MDIKILKYIIELIKEEKTGSPKELSQSVKLSERMMYNYLKLIREELMAPVKFDRSKNSYCFCQPGLINWEWQKNELKT
jgi:hypothetical protein